MDRVMKNSGLPWIGEIPNHWNIHPVYVYFSERKNPNYRMQEDNLLSLSYGKIIRKNINTNGGLLPLSFTTYNIVEAGDIIIRPTDLQNDKKSLRTGLVCERGIITSAYIALMPKFSHTTRYYHYMLHVADICKVFYNMGNGVRQGLNYSEFSKLQLLSPPYLEQQAIADYLDKKTSEIDAAIKEAQELIDKYKSYKQSVITEAVTKGLNPEVSMKESGVEWIGVVPEHWKIKRLGSFFIPRNERVSDKDFPPLSVTMKGILPQLETAAKTNDGDNRKLVRKGDFAINSRSDRRGSCGISNYDGSVSLINIVLRPLDEIFAKYYDWLFHSTMFSDEYYKWGHGIVDDLWTTSWAEMKKIDVAVPSIQEQEAIADYLDEKCAQIDSIISEKETLISQLQEYKKSIIFEYVTGKKEVPNG